MRLQRDDTSALRKAGFKPSDINRIRRVRDERATTIQQQEFIDARRLAFARWLVHTGRLTEFLIKKL